MVIPQLRQGMSQIDDLYEILIDTAQHQANRFEELLRCVILLLNEQIELLC